MSIARRMLRAADRVVAPWLRPLVVRFPGVMLRLQRWRHRLLGGSPTEIEGLAEPDLPGDQPAIAIASRTATAAVSGPTTVVGVATAGEQRPDAVRWRWRESGKPFRDAAIGPWGPGPGAVFPDRATTCGFAIPIAHAEPHGDGAGLDLQVVVGREPVYEQSFPLVSAQLRRRGGMPDDGVEVVGHASSEKGVGEAARSTIRTLEAAGVPVRVRDVRDRGSRGVGGASDSAPADHEPAARVLHLNPDQLLLYQRDHPHRDGDRDARPFTVGCWVWELPHFPFRWCGAFDGLDELWVPTRFVADSVQPVSPIPVVVMPLCLAPPPEPVVGVRARFGIPDDARLVLAMMDFHSVPERKNPLGCVEAFRRAFAGRAEYDDVHLLIKTSRGHDLPVEFARLQQAAKAVPRVHVVDRVVDRATIHSLVARCDVFLSLHRSEGFGFGALEALTAARPVVATNWSGTEDIISDATAWRVNSRLVTLERDFSPYAAGSQWAEPDLDHAADQLRDVFDNPAGAAERAARGQADVRERFDVATVGALARQRIESGLTAIAARGR